MGWKLIKKPDFKKIKADIEKSYDNFQDDLAKETLAAHKVIVANWKNKPTFVKVYTKKGNTRRLAYYVKDDEAGKIWWMVNNGTPRHKIPVGKKGFLVFDLGYRPKTTPVSYGGSGTATGPTIFTQKPVNHPGFPGRHFDRMVFVMTALHKGKKLLKGIGKALGL